MSGATASALPATPVAGEWRATSPAGRGNVVSFRIAPGQPAVQALNSYVYQQEVDFCVWGGSLQGDPTAVAPAPVGGRAFTHRHGLGCDAARIALGGALGARDTSLGLGAAGFALARVRRTRVDGRRAYRVEAERERERETLLYSTYARPRVDHSLWRAGQYILVFARLDPSGSSFYAPCTGSFALAFPALPAGAATAGHCASAAQPRGDPIPVQRGYAGLPKPVQIGDVIGFAGNGETGIDAASFGVTPDVGVMQQIERGERLPLTVTGTLASADQRIGVRVCFAGNTSGADQCGLIDRSLPGRPPQSRCTDIVTRKGDSGGPVYTHPRRGLLVRAVGIVSTAQGLSHHMCYTPIDLAATALGATVPPGPVIRLPGAGFPR